MTRQRRLILEVLRATRSHPTADWVYEQVKKRIPNISLGTVYRNLRLLKETGEIMELDYGKSFSRFDGNPKPHYHFVCRNCGRVYDVDMPVDEKLNQRVENATGNMVDYHRTEFYGTCKVCKERQTDGA